MNIIIEIYIFICIMLLLFDVVFLVVKNTKNKRFFPQKDKIKDKIQDELNRYDPKIGLSSSLKSFLLTNLDKTKNLIILQNELHTLTDHKAEIEAEIWPYILSKVSVYLKKSEYEQAYYAYVVSNFDDLDVKWDERFFSIFITFLDSKSLYVFSNAMNAIYKFADPYLMSISIQKVNERNGFYHSKLFVDGLLDYKGDQELLQNLILEKFYDYSSMTQESILNYFRLQGAKVEEFCLQLLKKREVHPEVYYGALRYFAKYPCPESKDICLDLLQNSETFWVEQLLAIQALKSYGDPLVKQVIRGRVTSCHWHVRLNAINYLHHHSLSKDEIFQILSLSDKYTNEALLYYYREEFPMVTYISEVLQSREEKQNQTKGMEPLREMVRPCTRG